MDFDVIPKVYLMSSERPHSSAAGTVRQRDRDRQVEELWSSEGCGASQHRTPATETSEQSGREFTLGNEVAQACDESIQAAKTRRGEFSESIVTASIDYFAPCQITSILPGA
jgi:hypothetical protein